MIVRLFALLALLFVTAIPARAADTRDYGDFAHLPILDGGRVKPIDSYARALLTALSGRDSIEGESAAAWLAQALFDPAAAIERPVFRLFRPELIGLPPRDGRLYSYLELQPALQQRQDLLMSILRRDEKDLSEDQRELLKLWENLGRYTAVLRAMSFAQPLGFDPPPWLERRSDEPLTLARIWPQRETVKSRVQQIVAAKGADDERYSDEERRAVDLAAALAALETSNGTAFAVIRDEDGEWQSPWDMVKRNAQSPAADGWQGLPRAYNEDGDDWDDRIAGLRGLTEDDLARKLDREVFYNRAHLLIAATMLYFAALLSLMIASLRPGGAWRRISSGLLAGGTAANLAAIILRVSILSRPPVGTLYESILFVAAVCAIAGFALERGRKDMSGLITGALGGLLLLCAAQAFAGEDSLQVLVAVLNTNFWLATHVLCITVGYGWCIAASLSAHVALARAALGRAQDLPVRGLKALLVASLLFTAVGTALGGIWADQSWGRFWGWDPKENGALLIVLWLVWLLHGAVGGQLGRLWLTAGTAFLSVIVALAWFGVNLLSVGLHSYGFISGVAAALAAFCLVETAIIGALAWRARQRTAS